ncbi:MAG: hypothetical protein IJZ22_00590 [Bacteroidaceae bacterium]|nr:hypothetical protein [Bacteroidaceae bacterium]
MKEKPTPAEVEATIEKFLQELHTQSLNNFSQARLKGVYAISPTYTDEEDEMYEDYNTDDPSPVDEEPVHESDEELYLLYRRAIRHRFN